MLSESEGPLDISGYVGDGNLGYISPEQTGRMNRMVDYRTDFYSLGIVVYALLTGVPPFVTEDSAAMIHCHIAKRPNPPHAMNAPFLSSCWAHLCRSCLSPDADR